MMKPRTFARTALAVGIAGATALSLAAAAPTAAAVAQHRRVHVWRVGTWRRDPRQCLIHRVLR